MEELFARFPLPEDFVSMASQLNDIKQNSTAFATDAAALSTMFHSIDLTSLNTHDSADSIRAFVNKVNTFAADYPDLQNVGGICVYPVFAPVLASTLKVPGVYKAVVAACFPSSQTFTDIKCAEVRKAVEFGANEIDIVISVGEFLDGNYEFVGQEIAQIKEAAAPARLKVILETGNLATPENIWYASVVAMLAGADMIKTSTGKNGLGATPEAAYVMCRAISEYYRQEHRRVGFKPAGGVSTVDDACYYYNIVRTVLGTEWLVPELFRIGTSRLSNLLLNALLKLRNPQADDVKYF